mgnify:CR=1 FL=1
MKNANDISYTNRMYLPVPNRRIRLWKTKSLCRHLGIDPCTERTAALHAAKQFQILAAQENIPLSYAHLAYKACLLRSVGEHIFLPENTGLSGEILLTHPLKDLSQSQTQILAAALCMSRVPEPCPKELHPYLRQLCPGKENRRIARVIAGIIRQASPAVHKDFSSMVKCYTARQISVIQAYSTDGEMLNADGVHDIRVAFRRLLSLCLVFSSLLQEEPVNAIVPGLKQGLKVLGKPRDLDVLQEKAEIYLFKNKTELKALPIFSQWLTDTRKEYVQKINAYFASPQYRAHIDALSNLENCTILKPVLEKGCIALPMTPSQVFHSCEHPLLSKTKFYDQWLHGRQAAEPVFHHLRLVYKDLRFLLEFFQDILTKKDLQYLKTCRSIQDTLGCIHDDSVILLRLHKLSPKLPAEEQEVIKNFLKWLKRDRKRQLKNFYRLT